MPKGTIHYKQEQAEITKNTVKFPRTLDNRIVTDYIIRTFKIIKD